MENNNPKYFDGVDMSDLPEHLKIYFQRKTQLEWIESLEKVLADLGGISDLATITDRVSGMRDLSNNSHLDATVRGMLNRNKKHFKSYDKGVWALISYNTNKNH